MTYTYHLLLLIQHNPGLALCSAPGHQLCCIRAASQGHDISVQHGPTSVTLVSSTVMGTGDPQAEKRILKVEIISFPPAYLKDEKNETQDAR